MTRQPGHLCGSKIENFHGSIGNWRTESTRVGFSNPIRPLSPNTLNICSENSVSVTVGRTFSMNLIMFSLISSFSSICVLYFVVKCVTYLLLHYKRYIIFWICESVSTFFFKKCTFTIDDWNEITNELKQFWNWELKKN